MESKYLFLWGDCKSVAIVTQKGQQACHLLCCNDAITKRDRDWQASAGALLNLVQFPAEEIDSDHRRHEDCAMPRIIGGDIGVSSREIGFSGILFTSWKLCHLAESANRS